MIRQLCQCALALTLVMSSAASAHEAKSGLIKKLIVNSPAMSARNVILELDGVTTMCTMSPNQESGYFNKVDTPDTFNSLISTLLTAQATGRSVIVFTVAGTEGCRIDQVQLAY